MRRAGVPGTSGLDAALAAVGDRWSLRIVQVLLGGPQRFGELQSSVEGIASNVLTQRLRRLEAARVVVARPYTARPPRVAYELTASGQRLAGALRLLSSWGAGQPDGAAPTHVACGTALDARWWCPTCGTEVEDPGGEALIHL